MDSEIAARREELRKEQESRPEGSKLYRTPSSVTVDEMIRIRSAGTVILDVLSPSASFFCFPLKGLLLEGEEYLGCWVMAVLLLRSLSL